MGKLKAYQTTVSHLYDTRATNILRESGRVEYLVLVAAESKEQAATYCAERNVRSVDARDLRLVQVGVPVTDAVREAGLLMQDGTVLITSHNGGGSRPVVLMDPEQGAQAIGVLSPTGRLTGERVFEAVMARYAMKGSIAAGADELLLNTGRQGPRRWASVWGVTSSDEEVQLRLDLGELKIIRSGYGDWFHAGRG